MQPPSDAQLLQNYAQNGEDAAFTELVHRHTNLVYSAALRQVDSPAVAAEITQSVFVGLAHGAKSLSPKLSAAASLAGWLCRSARNLSLNHRRDEFRRQTRERQAMEALISIPEGEPDWEQLRRVLDDAMSELNEADYDALVMRFFQKQDFHAVGAAIGVNDDTAQKRVSRALEKLRELLAQRGIRTTAAAALCVVISANAVQAAPAGLAVAISAAALGGATIATTATTAAIKTIAMTTLQKALVTATVTILAGAGIYEARHAAQLRGRVQTLQQQQAPLTGQIQQLQAERDETTRQLAALREDNGRLNQNTGELLRLRAEVSRLRQEQVNSIETLRTNVETARWKPHQMTNVGKATPLHALQTVLWAANSGNVDEIKRGIILDAAERNARIQNGTNFMVHAFSAGPPEFHVLAQRNIDAETAQIDVEEVVHPYRFTKTFMLRKGGSNEWKVLLFDYVSNTGPIPYDLLGF